MSKPFTLADVMQVRRAEDRTEARTFVKDGQEFELTIYADGRDSTARWYEVIGAMGQATIDCGMHPQAPLPKGREPGLKAVDPEGKVIRFTEPALVSQIYVFARVAVSPAFGLHEWAIFFDRMGPQLTEEITDWALRANGVDEYLFQQAAKVGKALGELGSDGRSTEHASSSSATSRSGRSEMSRSKKR